MNVKNFFNAEQKQAILKAIKDAEQMTSGEIRVHLESRCKGDVMQQTMRWFTKLKMAKTRQRNGTLIYLAIHDRKFAIYGDEGINKVVPDNFWGDVKEEMQAFFVKNQLSEGIISGIGRVGEKLKEFFPYRKDDMDELSDEISTGR
jgi:uncharacterized membrane protein